MNKLLITIICSRIQIAEEQEPDYLNQSRNDVGTTVERKSSTANSSRTNVGALIIRTYIWTVACAQRFFLYSFFAGRRMGAVHGCGAFIHSQGHTVYGKAQYDHCKQSGYIASIIGTLYKHCRQVLVDIGSAGSLFVIQRMARRINEISQPILYIGSVGAFSSIIQGKVYFIFFIYFLVNIFHYPEWSLPL